MSSVFKDFINQYSLQKTLRFELKPVGKTAQMLIDDNVFTRDQERQQSYAKIKPYIDKMHREFVNESLRNLALANLDDYQKVWIEYKKDIKDSKLQKQLDAYRKEFRKQIVQSFNSTAKRWRTEKYANLKLKKDNIEMLFEEGIFGVMKELFGSELETIYIEEDQEKSIFDGWKGFTGYFTKFFETRKNFYAEDGKASAIATRAQSNFERHLGNVELFNRISGIANLSEIEEFTGKTGDNIFTPEGYSSCLLQEGIDEYNDFLGGLSLENGKKIKGVNEVINEFRQGTGEKLPFLKKLDKQILSEKEKFIDEIEDDKDLLDHLNRYIQSADWRVNSVHKLFVKLVNNSSEHNLSGIFITKEGYNTISRRWTSNTEILNESLFDVLKQAKEVKSSDKKEGEYKYPNFMTLSSIKDAVEKSSLGVEAFWKPEYYVSNDNPDGFLEGGQDSWIQFLQILLNEFESLLVRREEIVADDGSVQILSAGYNHFSTEITRLINNFKCNDSSKKIIKDYVDEVLHIYQLSKYFAIEKKREWLSEYDDRLDVFYTEPEYGYLKFYEGAYEDIVQQYNKIRNYLTKKPYSESKWKLNFENPTLAAGWDRNKEEDNTAVLMRKNGDYYLGIMKKGHNRQFRDSTAHSTNESEEYYEKLVYKLLPDPSKMMPKVCFSQKGLDFFKPSEEILDIYENSRFKKGENFEISAMQKLIAFYTEAMSTYEGWQCYDIAKIKKSSEYKENMSEFFADVARAGYKISFEKVNDRYITDNNENGSLYLFRMHNKDFSKSSSGNKNLHSLYFEQLFTDQNSKQGYPLKLNGNAELFYRPRSLEAKREVRKKREVVVKKRYTEDKIFFHVPITLNRASKGNARVNDRINEFLAGNTDINVIGVDRGEKHLIYYSIIDQRGKVIKSKSLNVINGYNYAEELEKRANEREESRRSWQSVDAIKDLKKGYISLVVRELANLIIEHNAILVMEDLNMRFKQIRGGIEKSVYQQLEKGLIEKLSYLVDKKEADPDTPGHVQRGFQLTAPFESFDKMGKQTGVIFYTQASYTSKIDPLTGWRPNLYLKYSNAERAKNDMLLFDNIFFNAKKKRFEFTYDLSKFYDKADLPRKSIWTVCSSLERVRWERSGKSNQGNYKHYKDLTEQFRELFLKQRVDISSDIKSQVESIQISGNESFFKGFIYLFSLVCQIRNTQIAEDSEVKDFILSPVEPFFDSRRADEFGVGFPKDGDENGAYNIARKGLLILNKIDDGKGKVSWKDLYISSKEWDDFVVSQK